MAVLAKAGNSNPPHINGDENPYTGRQLLVLLLVFSIYFLILVKTSWQVATVMYLALPALVVFGYYLLKIPGLAIGLMISATSLDVMGRLGNTGVTVFHLFFAVSIGVFLVTRLWEGRLSMKVTGIEGLLLVFVFYITLTLFWSIERVDGLVSVLRLLGLLVTMYLTLNLTRNKNSVQLILLLTFIPAVLLSAYSGRDFLTSSGVEVKNALSMLKLFSRFGATFENPNYFATFLLFPMCIAFAGFAFLKMRFWKKIILFGIPMGIMAVAFVGTFSRSAWLAIFFAFLFIFSYFKNKRTWLVVGGIVVIVGSIALYNTAFFQSFVLRFASIFQGKADPSSATRFFLIEGGMRMFFESWGFGVGFESFPAYYVDFMPPQQTLSEVHECHTLPVEILAEQGWIGLFLFGAVIVATFKKGIQSVRVATDNFLRTIQIGMLAFLLGVLLNFCFMPGGLLNNFIWIAIGLIFSLAGLIDDANRKKSDMLI